MKLASKFVTIAMFCFVIFGLLPSAKASVVIGGTRVVYNQGESEITVKLTNNGKLPGLVKIWIDKGDPDAKPDTIDVPFTISPPLTRIDPTKSQMLRIIYTGEALPSDKESIFYLNVLEVPPKPTGDEASANQLQLAFRTRIKFFFRPNGLKPGQVEDAPGLVVWRLQRDGSTNEIEVSNPTPYYITFDRIKLGEGPQAAVFDKGGMVGPGETAKFPLKGNVPGAGAKVEYTAINDYGGPQNGEAKVTP